MNSDPPFMMYFWVKGKRQQERAKAIVDHFQNRAICHFGDETRPWVLWVDSHYEDVGHYSKTGKLMMGETVIVKTEQKELSIETRDETPAQFIRWMKKYYPEIVHATVLLHDYPIGSY